MSKKEKTPEKTDFQGAVSLEAILAAKQGKKAPETKKDDKTIVEPIKEIEKGKEAPIVEPIKPEVTPEGKEKEEVIVPPVPAPIENEEGTDAFRKANELIELGFLEDFDIQNPEDEESSIKVSEFKQMTDENLKELIQLHKQEKENNISSNFIPKEGLREHELKVIEILRNGGDLSQIAETEEEAFKRPFEDFDMDLRERQIDVLYIDYISGKGLDEDSAIALIKAKEQKGTLAADAKEVFDSYRTAHTKYIDGVLAEQKKKKEFKDTNFKENKKTLTAKLKESGLKESVYKKIASEYAKKNANGEHALIDKLKEALNNPEENHELIMHLADKNLFNETFKIKAAQESQKQIVRLATGAASKGNKQISKAKPQETDAPWLKAAQQFNETIKNK